MDDDPSLRRGQLGEAPAKRFDPGVEMFDLLGQAFRDVVEDHFVTVDGRLTPALFSVGKHLQVGNMTRPGQEPTPAVKLVTLPPENQVDLLEDVIHVAPGADQGTDVGEERPLGGRDLGQQRILAIDGPAALGPGDDAHGQ